MEKTTVYLTEAQKRALASRGLKDTHINVNMGDLERYCEGRLNSRKYKYPVDEEDDRRER